MSGGQGKGPRKVHRVRKPVEFVMSTPISKVLNFSGVTASILGLALGVAAIIGKEHTLAVIIPISYICALSAALVIWFAFHQRKARYAAAPAVLEKAYRDIQEASDSVLFGTENRQLLERKIGDSIDALAQAFTLLTGNPCRVCIAELFIDRNKPFEEPEKALLIRVIFRSGAQEGLRQETPQPVDGNSDFLYLLQSQRPFFHNDLGAAYAARKYENTKWNPDMIAEDSFPYRSTIVWPIKSTEGRLRGEETQPKQPLAFLCIDTPKKGAFVETSDVPLGACYAHAIYPVVRRLLAPPGPMTGVSEDDQTHAQSD